MLIFDDLPLAIPSSPAVSSARVASLGKLSRRTEAAMVMGRSASASCSGSGGAEDGDGEPEGGGEAMFVREACCDVPMCWSQNERYGKRRVVRISVAVWWNRSSVEACWRRKAIALRIQRTGTVYLCDLTMCSHVVCSPLWRKEVDVDVEMSRRGACLSHQLRARPPEKTSLARPPDLHHGQDAWHVLETEDYTWHRTSSP